jgi:hypothetical protein
MIKISMKAKKEVIEKQKKKYRKLTKKAKSAVIDSVVMTTGLSRDRASRLLSGKYELVSKKKIRTRTGKYSNPEFVKALIKMWYFMDNICSRRMVAGLPDMLDALTKFNEINFSQEITMMLKSISKSAIDRLLKPTRKKFELKGKSTTKPGSLLKKDITIRTADQWDDKKPGFVEIDLVAHCGETTSGEYINTLTVTDVCTGWTVTKSVINKAQRHVFAAIKEIRNELPFELLGIDSDNGSEFINHELYRYCKEENLIFTRSRPYKKNDNCYVEQKNWSIVRSQFGYQRYEGQKNVDLMNSIHKLYNDYSNFFLPSIKLKSKIRLGGHVKKTYEDPISPYRRLLKYIDNKKSDDLNIYYKSINPAYLKRRIVRLINKLINSKSVKSINNLKTA